MASEQRRRTGLLHFVMDSISDPDFGDRHGSLEEAMDAYELSEPAREAVRNRDLTAIRTALEEEAGDLTNEIPAWWLGTEGWLIYGDSGDS
jgi:hypothetical protein